MVNYSIIAKAYEPYSVVDETRIFPLTESDDRVLSIILKDNDGYVQVVIRQDTMLDVEAVNIALRRDLRYIGDASLGRLTQKLGIDRMCPWPGLNDGKWITVVDRRVFDLNRVEFAITFGDMVRLPKREFQDTFRDVTVSDITRPVGNVVPECTERDINSCIQEFTSLKIRRQLSETIEMPPLSSSARKLMEMRSNPNANLNNLVTVIERDPSLTANILRWARSPMYMHAGEVRDLRDAIGRVMGFDMVMNLAMGLVMSGVVEKPKDHPEGFIDYWQQAIWMSQLSSAVVAAMPAKTRPKSGLMSLIGLLHNFGYLVLSHVLPNFFGLICRHWETNRHLDTYVVEKQILGITREEIAAELFENWELPAELIEAVRWQKDKTYDGDYANYVDVLRLCRSLMVDMGLPIGHWTRSSKDLIKEMNIDESRLESKMDKLLESKDQIDAMAALL